MSPGDPRYFDASDLNNQDEADAEPAESDQLDLHGHHDKGHHFEALVVDGEVIPAVAGDPDDANFHLFQQGSWNCGIASPSEVVWALTGEHPNIVDETALAAEFGVLNHHGTDPENIKKWLEFHDIECHSNEHATFVDVLKELRDGNKVIVGVNSDALWNSNDALRAFAGRADHAIWLTAADASDPDHFKITINDSGRPDGAGIVYDLHDFESVLDLPAFHLVATGHGPSHLPEHPIGYDEEHGVFFALDEFLRDHGAAFAGAGVAAVATGLVASLRRRQADRQPPFAEPAPPKEAEGRDPVKMIPPLALPKPQARLVDMSQAERDRLLRNL